MRSLAVMSHERGGARVDTRAGSRTVLSQDEPIATRLYVSACPHTSIRG
jgi:hypothetical protein